MTVVVPVTYAVYTRIQAALMRYRRTVLTIRRKGCTGEETQIFRWLRVRCGSMPAW